MMIRFERPLSKHDRSRRNDDVGHLTECLRMHRLKSRLLYDLPTIICPSQFYISNQKFKNFEKNPTISIPLEHNLDGIP